MFNPKIHIGQSLSNREIMDTFGLGMQGGMRPSKKNNLLVLFSDHTKGLYEDAWQGDVLHYTGMGPVGDQSLEYSSNRILNESLNTGIDVFLFEAVEEKQHVYLGPVKLCAPPYESIQPDQNNNNRKVWIFPVQLLEDETASALTPDLIEKYENTHKQKAKKLSLEELALRLKSSGKNDQNYRISIVKQYSRNQYLAEYVKRLAKGKCALCNTNAPFNNQDGEPYLEVHHIEWLSSGGSDTIKNAVALCPNCHKRMHVLKSQQDIEVLKTHTSNRTAN